MDREQTLHPKTRRFFAQIFGERAEEVQTAAWLYQSDRDAFRARYLAAQETRDPARFLACFQVALRHDDLSDKHLRQYWARLVEIGRYDQALEVLTHVRRAADDPEYWLALATALAGTGRLLEAVEAASKVPPETPQRREAKALRDRMMGLIGAERRAGKFTHWRDMIGAVDGYFEEGLVAQAAPWLVKAAALTELDEEGAAAVLERAEVVFETATPGEALDLLLALRPIAERRGAEGWIDRTARILIGPGANPSPAAPVESSAADDDIELCCGLTLAAAGAWLQAIPLIGQVAVRQGAADRARLALARPVGREIIEAAKPSFRPRPQRKIVDVFPFFDELMLLQLRLEEMADWVDHFVILEATSTFTGKPKPLHFHETREAFARFADKIVHVPVEYPAHIDTPWAREFYQRDIALPKLAELCGEDDLVLVTDVDEIVRREAIEGFTRQYASFEMPTFAYFFNLRQVEETRVVRGAVWQAKYLQKIGLSVARLELLARNKKARLPDAGWHFTSIRDTADLPTKFQSYSHVSRGKLTARHFEDLMDRIRAGEEPGLVRCELDDSFPGALRRNRERLGAFLL